MPELGAPLRIGVLGAARIARRLLSNRCGQRRCRRGRGGGTRRRTRTGVCYQTSHREDARRLRGADPDIHAIYNPLALRAEEIIASGVGTLVRVEAALCFPLPMFSDIRYDYSLAHQPDAFAGAVQRGEPVKTTPEDAVENMTVIDAIYRAAGLPLREPS